MFISDRARLTAFFRTILLTLLFAVTPASAQDATKADPAAGEDTAEEEVRTPTLELGSFKINDLRPTRNETARLTFTLHLAFSKDLTEKQVEQFEKWKHRLRDQVITAVRVSEMKDFQEPNLGRLRRRILIRVNRLLKRKLAEEVLVTKYLFRLY